MPHLFSPESLQQEKEKKKKEKRRKGRVAPCKSLSSWNWASSTGPYQVQPCRPHPRLMQPRPPRPGQARPWREGDMKGSCSGSRHHTTHWGAEQLDHMLPMHRPRSPSSKAPRPSGLIPKARAKVTPSPTPLSPGTGWPLLHPLYNVTFAVTSPERIKLWESGKRDIRWFHQLDLEALTKMSNCIRSHRFSSFFLDR